MPHIPITNLFNAYDLQPDLYAEDKIQSQEVVHYFEARFQVALQAIIKRSEHDQEWLYKLLLNELVFLILQIGFQ
jgi:hypothetical protein